MTAPSTSNAGPSSQPFLRTKYKKAASFEPVYTGNAATALTSDGQFLFAPVNDTIHVTQVSSGKSVTQIPSDLEEVTCLTLSPDQSTLLVASRSLALRIFSIQYTLDTEDAMEVDDLSPEKNSQSVSWKLLRSIPKTHDAPVVVMQVDPTSTLVATGSSDTCVKIWDFRGGFCTHVFRGHGGVVSSLAWNMPATQASQSSSPHTIELFTGSIDGRIRLWNLRADQHAQKGTKPVATLESHFSVVRGLAVSKDGTRLVSAGRDRMLAFWQRFEQAPKNKRSKDSTIGSQFEWRQIDSLSTTESLETAGFLGQSDTFYTGGSEGEVRLWSFERRAVTAVQPNGRFARGIAASNGKVNGEEEEDEEETRAITETHWLPSVQTIVSVHADQNIVFRSTPTLEKSRQLAGFNDQIIDASFVSPIAGHHDTHLAVATNSTTVLVYTLDAEQHNVEILPGESTGDEGHSGLVLCLDRTTDGLWLASGGKDRSVRIWAMVPRSARGSLDQDEEVGEVVRPHQHNDSMSSNGSANYEWRCIAIAEGHTESVGAIAFARRPQSPEAVGAPFLVSGSQDRTAKIWDLTGLAAHVDKYFSNKQPSQEAFQPLRLTSLSTLKIHEKDINALDISPNNALLLTGSQDKTAKVFGIHFTPPSKTNGHQATASLKLITICRGHKRGVWSVTFSPADAVFLTGSSDRTMKLWSINDGFACVKNFVGHTNSVLKVRFLRGSKGLQCLSGASDGLVKVWNVRTEECVDTLDGHEERVWGLDCSRSGDTIVSGGADGVINFWSDWTKRQEEVDTQERQQEVEQEQQFTNFLSVKDYRNAISLALGMHQPRRLLQLLTTIDAQRANAGSSVATGSLLGSALRQVDNQSVRDTQLAELLSRAGVIASAPPVAHDDTQHPDISSITGSAAVDEVFKSLQSQELATLLTFVRDWNTSVRTSTIAQTTLHAILRYHSADKIIAAFEQTKPRESTTNLRKGAADLGNVIESILPYTQRHYDRAQRILTESAMLEYTLASMDTVLGPEEFADLQMSDAEQNPIDIVTDHASFHDVSESESEEP